MSARSLRLPGIGAHHSANPQSDEWFTPPEILGRLPAFDLDPCAPIGGPMPWARVGRHYTVEDDGLTLPWTGHVWLNPPYSEAAPWLDRMADHGDGIALVFARCETGWWHDSIWPHASRVLFLCGRVTFWSGPEERSKPGHNSGGPSALVAFGQWASDVLVACDLAGAVVSVDQTR